MQGAYSVAAGDLVGSYRIDEALSSSDAFQVFRAWDLARERRAILEIAWPEVGGADAAGARLVRESELLARAVELAEDSHLIAIYEVGTIEVQGRPRVFRALACVGGRTIRDLLDSEGPIAPTPAAAIVSQTAAGLDAAHGVGLVHQTLTPDCVVLDGDRVYLGGFGRHICTLPQDPERLPAPGYFLPPYMAPEIVRGEQPDARADVYALGCILYELLTGTPPFQRDLLETLRAHLQDPPPVASDAPGVPATFDPVIQRAMSKTPEERYSQAGELGRAAVTAAQAGTAV
jgi:serine/threonine kinase PknH